MKKRNVVHRPERDRAIFAVLHHVRGIANAEVARRSGLSAQTIKNWRTPIAAGGTRFPQFYTLNRVAKAFGMEFKLVEREDRRDGKSDSKGEPPRLHA